MNKRWILGIAMLLVLSGVGTACSSSTDASGHEQDATIQMQGGAGDAKSTPGTKGEPSIDADIKVDGRNATITYKVNNFKLAGEHMDKANMPGEGHLHISVDNVEKAMLKSDAAVKLENLKPGKHTVKLTLQQNDHTPTGIAKELQIEVK